MELILMNKYSNRFIKIYLDTSRNNIMVSSSTCKNETSMPIQGFERERLIDAIKAHFL